MPSVYPNAIDVLDTGHVDGVLEVIHADDINMLADAVMKMQLEIGPNPSAAFANLVARLTDIDNRIAGGSHVVNVKAPPYNAVGDGVADDTVAIVNAIAAIAALGGGIVYLPAGIYRVRRQSNALLGAIQMLSLVTLQGAGMGATTVRGDLAASGGFSNQEIIRFTNCYGAGVRDMTIDGNITANQVNGYTGCAVRVDSNSSYIGIRNVEMRNCAYAGLLVYGGQRVFFSDVTINNIYEASAGTGGIGLWCFGGPQFVYGARFNIGNTANGQLVLDAGSSIGTEAGTPKDCAFGEFSLYNWGTQTASYGIELQGAKRCVIGTFTANGGPSSLVRANLGIGLNEDQNSGLVSGTVQATTGQAAIVGTGTLFTRQLVVNGDIVLEGTTYHVLSITDDTHATLDVVYAGAGGAGLTAVAPGNMAATDNVIGPGEVFNIGSEWLKIESGSRNRVFANVRNVNRAMSSGNAYGARIKIGTLAGANKSPCADNTIEAKVRQDPGLNRYTHAVLFDTTSTTSQTRTGVYLLGNKVNLSDVGAPTTGLVARAGTAAPVFFGPDANLTNRKFFLPLAGAAIRTGAPVYAKQGTNGRYSAWSFSDTADEDVVLEFQFPPDMIWGSGTLNSDDGSGIATIGPCLLNLWWANLGAGAGNVVWYVQMATGGRVAGDNLNTGLFNSTGGVEGGGGAGIVAAAQDILTVTQSALMRVTDPNASYQPGRLYIGFVGRKGSDAVNDTVANRVGLLMVEVVYIAVN